MKKTIVVVGFGPGISTAVAEKFGASGYSVALVGRTQERLSAGVKALETKNIRAGAFRADAGDPVAIRGAVREASATLGPVAVLFWNAYGGAELGDLLGAEPTAIRAVFDIAIVGLVAATQEALPDLKSTKGAVLVTNGAFGEINPQVDAFAVSSGFAGLALANGAKHKLVGLLSKRLEREGVYVGEVMVAGSVKGTAWDQGQATIEAAAIANKYWDMHEARQEIRARIA
jgi:NADP-dependent 3-hydroxy acid dehydrogenase YdfG